MLLSNLIKTRLRASRLCLLICCAATLGLGIIGAIITPIAYDIEFFEQLYLNAPAIAGLLQITLTLLSQLCSTGITTAMSIGNIFLYYSMFTMYGTQSAYLYFTLPRSRRDIFHASLLTYTIESTILFTVSIVSMIIYGGSYVIAFEDILPLAEAMSVLYKAMSQMGALYTTALIISAILAFVGTILLSVITPATCCVYGCSFAKKHKLVGTIVATFAVSAIQSTVLTIGLFVPMLIYVMFAAQSNDETVLAYMIPFIMFIVGIVTAALAIVMYFMTRNRLEKKFDIE